MAQWLASASAASERDLVPLSVELLGRLVAPWHKRLSNSSIGCSEGRFLARARTRTWLATIWVGLAVVFGVACFFRRLPLH